MLGAIARMRPDQAAIYLEWVVLFGRVFKTSCAKNDMRSGRSSRLLLAGCLVVWAVFSLAPFARAQSLPQAAADVPVDVPTHEAGFYLHHFVYDPPATNRPQTVFVGGDFNQWSR